MAFLYFGDYYLLDAMCYEAPFGWDDPAIIILWVRLQSSISHLRPQHVLTAFQVFDLVRTVTYQLALTTTHHIYI